MIRTTLACETARRALPGALVALALIALPAKVVNARTWEEWAPAPLASDSAYAALTATPRDQLDENDRRWLDVQWSWRAQREAEKRSWSKGISESRSQHVKRKGDERFAALASRPPASLGEGEFEWLVAESEAQQHASHDSSGSSIWPLVVIVVGVGAFLLGAAYGIDHAYP